MNQIKREKIHCPVCNNHDLVTRSLHCRKCDLEVKAMIEDNEFSKLSGDLLHFLRVFVHCDGKIKDMEKALGISYPSVKSKLSDLKSVLNLSEVQHQSQNKSTDSTPFESSHEILERMEKGDLSYDEALAAIKNLK